jgi:hypothetical protein
VCTGNPVTSSQLSTVHGLLSSIVGGMPGTQCFAPSHMAMPLHLMLSSQVVPAGSGSWTGAPAAHESAVQGLPSSTMTGVPPQRPLEHLSAVVHESPSSHAVPLGFVPSAGHDTAVPVHDSAKSQALVAGRQIVPALPAVC